MFYHHYQNINIAHDINFHQLSICQGSIPLLFHYNISQRLPGFYPSHTLNLRVYLNNYSIIICIWYLYQLQLLLSSIKMILFSPGFYHKNTYYFFARVLFIHLSIYPFIYPFARVLSHLFVARVLSTNHLL